MNDFVLIVDEDPEVLELRSLQLISQGFNVVTAKGTEIALEMLSLMGLPRALLLDISRGKATARGFLRRLSERLPRFSEIVPVVFVTGKRTVARRAVPGSRIPFRNPARSAGRPPRSEPRQLL